MNIDDHTSSDYDADAAVRKATSRIGGLSTWGRTPDPDERADALRRLAVARIDREVRQQTERGAPSPDPQEIAHLVGLLLMWGGSTDAQAVERLERAVREAFYVTPTATAEDCKRIARMITDGGQG